MDLWEWIHARKRTLRAEGQTRLATLVDTVSHHVVELDHAQVDAIVPEALALARARGDVWLEVYFRHWELQSKVLSRRYGERALGRAVELVEFSHRDEARDCPQSVCSVQDLAACYGVVDGPGWAPERLEVTGETLARIDPSWGCFDCLSSEHGDALRDAGDAEGALRFVDAQQARVATARVVGVDRNDFCTHTRVAAMMALGRDEAALAHLDRMLARPRVSRTRLLWRRAHRALALARLERFDEARDALLSPDDALASAELFDPWSDCVERLVRAGRFENDAGLGRLLGHMCDTLDENGSARGALHLAARHGRLAVARGEAWTARRALARMERCVPRLRAPLDALARVSALRALVATLEADAPVFETLEAALQAIYASPQSLEENLSTAEAALARWPDDERLTLTYASLLLSAQHRVEAADLLERFSASHPVSEQVALLWGEALGPCSPERFEHYAATVQARAVTESAAVTPSLFRGLRAMDVEDWSTARALLTPLLAHWPEAVRTRRALGYSLLRLGEAAEAQRVFDDLARLAPDDRGDPWDRMAAAAMLGDWPRVRAAAAQLGVAMPEGEGLVEDWQEECVIRLDGDLGRVEHRARRTTPVTARLITIPRPDEEALYHDLWVFDARPLNAPPPADATEEQKRAHRWIYRGLRRLEGGGYRAVQLDGAAPDRDARNALLDALRELGCAYQGHVGGGYKVLDPERDDGELDGLYLCLAVPPSVTDAALHARLTELDAGLARHLAWPDLARAAGDAEAAERHLALLAKYGIARVAPGDEALADA